MKLDRRQAQNGYGEGYLDATRKTIAALDAAKALIDEQIRVQRETIRVLQAEAEDQERQLERLMRS